MHTQREIDIYAQLHIMTTVLFFPSFPTAHLAQHTRDDLSHILRATMFENVLHNIVAILILHKSVNLL